MDLFSQKIHDIHYYVSADTAMRPYAQLLLNTVKLIPNEQMQDGYKLELGFSIFTFIATTDGYQIVAPDYLNNPFQSTTDDLTLALWILFQQSTLIRKTGVDAVPTRFDDQVVVAQCALEQEVISLQRFPDLGPGASGWCVEAIEKEPDGQLQAVSESEFEALYAYQLLQKRPSLIKALALPYNYLVVFDGDEIQEILNDQDESVLPK